jgi:hypothetical protein
MTTLDELVPLAEVTATLTLMGCTIDSDHDGEVIVRHPEITDGTYWRIGWPGTYRSQFIHVIENMSDVLERMRK